MKKFKFFVTVLLIIILVLLFGLIKNRTGLLSDSDENSDVSYVISASKGQALSLVRKSENVFTLKGNISDGTHNSIIIRVLDKNNTKSVLINDEIPIKKEPFEYDIELPKNKDSAYLDLYFDDRDLAITLKAVTFAREEVGNSWIIQEHDNTENNRKILGKGKPKDYTFSDSELKQVTQQVLTLSDTITKSHESDLDKAYAIYLWLCEHMYMTDKADENSFEYIYNTRIVDNQSYVNYFATLLRAQNIPCTIVECDGYYFNEVYVNDKWINVQIDRDTFNRYKDGRYIYDRKNLYTHFGVPTDIISANYVVKSHKK